VATAELLVDTDVLIDHLRGHRQLRADGRRLAVSVITRAELFAGGDAPAVLRDLLATMIELSVDATIAELAGVTRRRHQLAMPTSRPSPGSRCSHQADALELLGDRLAPEGCCPWPAEQFASTSSKRRRSTDHSGSEALS
jgi:hypothetical protein